MGCLPQTYKYAFMLDTLNAVSVDGFDTPEVRADALAGTERGRMQTTRDPWAELLSTPKRERYECKVMVIALEHAQETQDSMGGAGWRLTGQSNGPANALEKGTLKPMPPSLILSFARTLTDERPDLSTEPAVDALPRLPVVP
jgi:hypothetical protein